MLNPLTWRLRQTLERAEAITGGDDRYIDFGARVITVEPDETGIEVMAGRPRQRVLESANYGGILDTRTMSFVGPSPDPVCLWAGREQAPLIRHDDGLPPRILTYGGEGAGKTRGVLAPWLLLRALELTGQNCEIGGTAPTAKRLSRLIQSLHEIMPPEWFTYRSHDGLFTLANGTSIRCVSTKRYSEDVGSPIQGWDWAAAGSDELQDSLDANDDIEARGRRAPGGVYRRMCTATAKDSPEWRELRDRVGASPRWTIARLPGRTNPFVPAQYWETLRGELTERAYRRRVLAEDVRPERAVYPAFERETNVIAIPDIGWRDVTKHVLAAATGERNHSLLVGHDPGQICDVSICLKAYEIKGRPGHVWVVVDELTTHGTTAEEHAVRLRDRLRERFGVMKANALRRDKLDRLAEIPHVRIDPYGDNEQRPDKSVHTMFSKLGFHVRSAAYKNGKGTGRIDREARIEMVNRLLRSANGTRRLFVACDPVTRAPVAKRLVAALEMSERDVTGKAEAQKKDSRDLSHWPAALGYALHRFERVRRAEFTYQQAAP